MSDIEKVKKLREVTEQVLKIAIKPLKNQAAI